MAGAADRFKQQMNAHLQQTAVQVIDALDKSHDQYKSRVLADLKALKAGQINLDQIKVSDTDYEVMPEKPQIQRKSNGDAPIPDVREEAKV